MILEGDRGPFYPNLVKILNENSLSQMLSCDRGGYERTIWLPPSHRLNIPSSKTTFQLLRILPNIVIEQAQKNTFYRQGSRRSSAFVDVYQVGESPP